MGQDSPFCARNAVAGKRHLFALLFFAISFSSAAQYQESLMFGFKVGAGWSSISGLPAILVPEDFYSGYTFESRGLIRPAASLFVTYRLPDSPIGLEGRLTYSQHSVNLVYSDIMNFTYTCKFHYHYIGGGAYIRAYILSGLNVAVGMRMGINLTPENIDYVSNSHEIEWPDGIIPDSDAYTRDELRNVIKGLNTSELSLLVGYEFVNGFSIDLGYSHGLNDVIETFANRHNFGNPINNPSAVWIAVGYAISVDAPPRRHRRGR